MLQRIVYYKENMEKDNNRVTVENIINLRNIKNKKKKKKNFMNKDIISARFEKIGIKYDNLPVFESHFESGNLQLVYANQIIDENNKIIDLNNINNNGNISIENNDTNTNIFNDTDTDIGLNNSININNNSITNLDYINDSVKKENVVHNNDTINNNISTKRLKKIEKYELFLTNDTNTSGYTQWFFFRVSNIRKGKTINFNIMNFLRKTTKYCNGIKI